VLTRTTTKDGHLKAGHDKNFAPAKKVQEPVKAAFDHMNERADVKK